MKRALSKRFGVPLASTTMFCVAPPMIALATIAGVAVGFALKYAAAIPATCGDAIDVPSSVFVAVSLAMPTDRMPTPGANRSTQLPKFENDARVSVIDVAPTVIAS